MVLGDRADALDLKGIYLGFRNEWQAAQAATDEAVGMMRAAVARDGANTMVRERLYRILFDRGRIEGAMGRYPEALATLEETRAGLAALFALKPYDRNLRATEAYANLRLAEIKFTTGDRDGARASYRTAKAIFDELKAAKPADTAYDGDLILIDAMLASLGEGP